MKSVHKGFCSLALAPRTLPAFYVSLLARSQITTSPVFTTRLRAKDYLAFSAPVSLCVQNLDGCFVQLL